MGRRVCLVAAVVVALAMMGVARASAAVSFQTTDYALGTGESASAMAVGDLDGKNGPDLVAAGDSPSGEVLTVLLNNGDGTFGTPERDALPSNCGPVQLELYDFENTAGQPGQDGNLDALVACASGNLVSLAGNGDGGFGAPQVLPNPNLYSDSFTARDRFVIGAFGYYSRAPIVAFALADTEDDGGTFCSSDDFSAPGADAACEFSFETEPGTTDDYPALEGGTLMVPVDFAGTGQQDVITEADDGLTIWNQTPGPPTEPAPAVWSGQTLPDSYVPGSTEFTSSGAPIAIATGDLNGDGRQDIITASATGNGPQGEQLNTIMDLGASGFGAAKSFPTLDGIAAIVTGDFDGDGHTDVFAANGYGEAVVQSGDGAGNLGGDANVIPLLGYGNPDYADVIQADEADIDDNGTPDVVVLDDQAGTFEVLKNLNPGTGPTPTPTPTPPPPVPTPTPLPISHPGPGLVPAPSGSTGSGTAHSVAKPLSGISKLVSKVKLGHRDVLTLGQAANPPTSAVTLTLTVPAPQGKHSHAARPAEAAAAAAHAGARKSKRTDASRRVVLGRATIKIPPGAKRSLTLRLNVAGRRLLARHARVSARLTILAAGSGGTKQTQERKLTIARGAS